MGNYNRRKRGHDYFGPFIYHIILKKRESAPVFSRIIGNASIAPGFPGAARADYTRLGYAIASALAKFENIYPEFLKKQYSIMPDHVHIIFQKLKRTPIHLETYMEILKDMVAEYYSRDNGSHTLKNDIFQERFTDKLLYTNVSLNDWILYVKHNPHRRAMMMQRPDFFQRKRDIRIDGKQYEAFGNLFLLRNPDKFPVRIRRSFTEIQKQEHHNYSIELCAEGTILVSPFISKAEKEIRAVAEELGGKLILICHEEFGERFKPARHDFELCSSGRLLIISLGMPKGTPLSHSIATTMNELAKTISDTRFAD